ncbi:zinc-ribbon domain containing protein [Acidobacteriota bacterium]
MPNLSEPAGRAGGRKSSSKDRDLDCAECGKTFIFTEGEQKFYKEKGLEWDPRRCPTCRNQRKSRTQNTRDRRTGQPANRPREYRRGGCISGRVFAQMGHHGNHRRPGNHQGFRSNSDQKRQDSRPNRSQSNNSHPIICARCGKQAFVPFTPRNKAVVYCPDCYRVQKRQKDKNR